ncbi:MAG: hypothetical protein IT357_15385, partial [Gemmatimonadaceae bacterium]|nr:hypothetical protein [Gemmatimonadaceae bacterium]
MPGFVVGAALAGIFGGSAIAGGIITLGFSLKAFASALILGGISHAMQKKPQGPSFSGGAASQGRLITTRQPIAPWQIVFGECRVGGVLTFRYISSDKTYWHMVLTLAGHPCKAVDRVYIGNEEVPLDESGGAIGKYENRVRVKISLGDELGQPFPDLVSESNGRWSNSHRQSGCTKVWVRLHADLEKFPAGVPNFSFQVRGALVYDHRTGVTDWTNNAALLLSHYLTEPTIGFGADFDDEIHQDDLTAAANACDESVPVGADRYAHFTVDASANLVTITPGSKTRWMTPRTGQGVRVQAVGTSALPNNLSAGVTYYVVTAGNENGEFKLAASLADARRGTIISLSSGSGTLRIDLYDEPRYTVNGAFLVAETPKDVILRINAAMAGSAVNLGDRWHINAGVYHVPTITLDESDLAGASQVQAHVPLRESANAIKGIFTNPAAYWQPDDFPPITSDAYLEQDGGERRWKDIDVSAFVTSVTQAQRLAKIDLLRMRQALTESATFKMTGWAAVPGRSVARTDAQYGWSAKAFEVQDTELSVVDDDEGNPTLAVRHLLRETAAAVYDWSTDEEGDVDDAPNTNLPDPGAITAPGVPSVIETLYETSGSAGLKSKLTVSWAAPADAFVAQYQLEWKADNDTTWTVIANTAGRSFEILDVTPGVYDIRVKAIGTVGNSSDYAQATVEARGTTEPPTDVTGFTVIASSGFAFASWDLHPALDVRIGGRIEIRHEAVTSGAAWNNGVVMKSFDGNAVTGPLPLVTGTYMAKAVDSADPVEHYSEGAVSFVLTEGMVTGFTTVDTLTEAPTFSGTKVNCAVVSSTLRLSSGVLFDSASGNFDDAAGNFDAFGGQETSGTYTFGPLDLATVAVRRFEADIAMTGFDNGEYFDAAQGNFDAADGLFDGDDAAINDALVVLHARLTDDDPGGSPTWGEWFQFHVADLNCRAAQFRLDLSVSTPAHNVAIS